MRSATTRLVIVGLLSLFLALPTVTAVAEEQPEYAVAQATTTAPPATGTTAPAGPKLEPADTEADRAEQRRKIVMGVASVILIGVVIWGRSIRRKRRKKTEGS